MKRPKAVPSTSDNSEIRLNRYLASSGLGSRRGCDDLIRSGAVSVDGTIELEPGRKVTVGVTTVRVDGKSVRPFLQWIYVLVNKPRGVVVTLDDPRERPVIMDLVPRLPARVFPVGRLDLNSTGLVLLTNHGDLAERLSHPRYEVPRTYRVKVSGHLTDEQAQRLRDGVRLEDGRTRPAQVRIVRRNRGSMVLDLTLREGRNRQVRRMMDVIGHPVRRLNRIRLGPLVLDGMPLGEARLLGPTEASELLESVGLES